MSIKHNLPRQDALPIPKCGNYFNNNYQNVNSIVKQVQRMNLDITSQNQQLKDILSYLNTSKSSNKVKTIQNRNKIMQKSALYDFQESAKTVQSNSAETVVINFQAELNKKLKIARKSRNKGTLVKQKNIIGHLKPISQHKQSTDKLKTQQAKQYISNYDLLQNHKFKQRKLSKSMKRCHSCSKIYVKQDQNSCKSIYQHQTTQKKKTKKSLNMSTSVLVLDSKTNSNVKQELKTSQHKESYKISANTHKIILGSPKNLFSGVIIGSSQKSQLKDFFKARNNKKSSLIISQISKSKKKLC